MPTRTLAPVSSEIDDAVRRTSAAAQKALAAPRKVLHVINGEHYSGAERVQDLLALRLPDFGYQVSFACLKSGNFAGLRKSLTTELLEAPMQCAFDLRPAFSLAKTARLGRYEIIHAHTVRAALVGSLAARLATLPLVYHVHSPASQDSTRRLANRINGFVERVCLQCAEQIVCVSHSLLDHMRSQGLDASRLAVVPNGVPVRDSLCQRAAPSRRWVLGMVALFRPRKGTEVLIEALAILLRQGYDVRVRAVGPFESAAYENQLRRLASQRRVDHAMEWTGFRRDVNAEFEQMDALVLPSLFGEGLPMVVLEAMAAGVPVIGSDVQGISEVLREGSGLVTTPGSADALARAIESLIRGQTSWNSLRENAWRRQAQSFSDHSMAADVARIYDQILASA